MEDEASIENLRAKASPQASRAARPLVDFMLGFLELGARISKKHWPRKTFKSTGNIACISQKRMEGQ